MRNDRRVTVNRHGLSKQTFLPPRQVGVLHIVRHHAIFCRVANCSIVTDTLNEIRRRVFVIEDQRYRIIRGSTVCAMIGTSNKIICYKIYRKSITITPKRTAVREGLKKKKNKTLERRGKQGWKVPNLPNSFLGRPTCQDKCLVLARWLFVK